jgi:glycosyltransferase involved in cell wall biosynthesis
MKKVISILHHPLPQEGGRLAEEAGFGWHFRSAKALARYGGYRVIAARPCEGSRTAYRFVDGVAVLLTPSANLSPSPRIWKWSWVSNALVELAEEAVKQGFLPYVHEYRALNSELVIRRIADQPVILQHHGSLPPSRSGSRGLPDFIKGLSKLRRERYLRRIRGVFFVLNEREKFYLENVLNVDAEVVARTMAADFDELKPPSDEEKVRIRKSIGIDDDTVVLRTYVGVFGEEFSGVKGAQHLLRIWRELRSRFEEKVAVIVTGIGEPYLSALRRAGMLAYKWLPHGDYVKLVKASDVYFLPATSAYSHGGIGVAVMEAMAMGIPVVSPTLRDFPEPDRVKDIGALTGYIDNEEALREFIDALAYVIENRGLYKPWIIRELGRKYYSWESFVRDFDSAVRKL